MSPQAGGPAPDRGFLRFNSFLSERFRLHYVSTPKVACTSLKWWFADLEGRAAAIRSSQASQESDPELVIHDVFHRVAPDVTGFADALLDATFARADLFRFALVRNPYKRVLSAWQSKVLLLEPLQLERLRGQPLLDLPLAGVDDLRAAFQAFLESLAGVDGERLRDEHWAGQAELLRPDCFRYDAVAQVEDTGALAAALRERLPDGVPSPFTSRRANESLLPWSPDLFTQRARELVEKLYAEDFSRFGYPLALPDGPPAPEGSALELALQAIRLLRARHRRLHEMRGQWFERQGLLEASCASVHEQAVVWQAEAERLQAQRANLQARQADLESQLADVERQLGGLQSRLAGLQAQRAQLEQQAASRQEALQSLEARHAALETAARQDREALQASVRLLEGTVAGLQGQLSALLHSRSWRITRPLRQLSKLLGGGRRDA